MANKQVQTGHPGERLGASLLFAQGDVPLLRTPDTAPQPSACQQEPSWPTPEDLRARSR